MILQALVNHYEDLLARGEIAPPGWKTTKVSYALCINEAGELESVESLMQEVDTGKKTVNLPTEMWLPAPEGKRSSGVAPNFLSDNSKYFLGFTKHPDKNSEIPIMIDEKTMERFDGAGRLHKKLLEGINSPAARAICK